MYSYKALISVKSKIYFLKVAFIANTLHINIYVAIKFDHLINGAYAR